MHMYVCANVGVSQEFRVYVSLNVSVWARIYLLAMNTLGTCMKQEFVYACVCSYTYQYICLRYIYTYQYICLCAECIEDKISVCVFACMCMHACVCV